MIGPYPHRGGPYTISTVHTLRLRWLVLISLLIEEKETYVLLFDLFLFLFHFLIILFYLHLYFTERRV